MIMRSKDAIKSQQSASRSGRPIMPCLWFEDNAKEAVDHYLEIFPNSRILSTVLYTNAGPLPKGTILTITFELDGTKFMAINGGPYQPFSPAISFVVECDTQKDIDRYWEQLSAGGTTEQCGWLKDKFGVSWQIVPSNLGKLLLDNAKSEHVMEALLKMEKLDMDALEQAAET